MCHCLFHMSLILSLRWSAFPHEDRFYKYRLTLIPERAAIRTLFMLSWIVRGKVVHQENRMSLISIPSEWWYLFGPLDGVGLFGQLVQSTLDQEMYNLQEWHVPILDYTMISCDIRIKQGNTIISYAGLKYCSSTLFMRIGNHNVLLDTAYDYWN